MQERPAHPAFPQPSDINIPLWRYMETEKFEWLVNQGRLFMPTSDRLGDPLEGSTPAGEINKWQNLLKTAKTDRERMIIKENREFIASYARQFRYRYYVSCWHINKYENSGMWAAYTNTPNSVAIRVRYNTLRKYLPHYVDMGLVRYIDYKSDSFPTMNMFEYIMHKEKYFEFENEVRIVAFPPIAVKDDFDHFNQNHSELGSEPKFFYYAPEIDLGIIQDIIFHPEASAVFQTKISNICDAYKLPTPKESRSKQQPLY